MVSPVVGVRMFPAATDHYEPVRSSSICNLRKLV
jgi:hypothetical protein